MRKGISLTALAQKIEANKIGKKDFISDPAEHIRMVIGEEKRPLLTVGMKDDGDVMPLNGIAHDQLATHLGIPGRYYDRMMQQMPENLAADVNGWLQRRPAKERRMVRTLKTGDEQRHVRAFLSNAYQRIENEEIAEVVLPILADIKGLEIASCEITERRMYIQAVTPTTLPVKVGDEVRAGVIISNSEVGQGAVSIAPMVYRLVCLNGMICPDGKFRGYHVGRRVEDTEALYADDTKKADDRAVLLKVRDHVKAAVDQIRFRDRVQKMAGLAEAKILGNPEKSIEVLAKKVGATEGERTGILRSLIEGGTLSAWGLLNAVTHQAHTIENYDRSVEFESMGGQLLELSPREWKPILEAA